MNLLINKLWLRIRKYIDYHRLYNNQKNKQIVNHIHSNMDSVKNQSLTNFFNRS